MRSMDLTREDEGACCTGPLPDALPPTASAASKSASRDHESPPSAENPSRRDGMLRGVSTPAAALAPVDASDLRPVEEDVTELEEEEEAEVAEDAEEAAEEAEEDAEEVKDVARMRSASLPATSTAALPRLSSRSPAPSRSKCTAVLSCVLATPHSISSASGSTPASAVYSRYPMPQSCVSSEGSGLVTEWTSELQREGPRALSSETAVSVRDIEKPLDSLGA